jgi:L-Ala-D/L-Glu epimerase
MTLLRIAVERWPLGTPLRDGGGLLTELEVIVVTLEDKGFSGHGEAAGVHYRGETAACMVAQIEELRPEIEAGASRGKILGLLPAGGARNALDCALWDLEAKQAGAAAWQMAGFTAPEPLLTTYTIGAAAPESMAARAAALEESCALKLKLTGEAVDAERVRAVREARRDVWLCVDANQAFTSRSLEALLPALLEAGVELIEQPFPAGDDAALEALRLPIPVAADESLQSLDDLASLAGRYDLVNIKLDKCGGLTAALALAHAARRLGFQLMVGNMVGTTLAMAPAFLVGQLCRIVDLDGPLFLREDRAWRARYEGGRIWCPEAAWGGGRARLSCIERPRG